MSLSTIPQRRGRPARRVIPARAQCAAVAGRGIRGAARGVPLAGMFLAACGLVAGGLVSPVRAVSVDPRHPRILFYADSLDAVRARTFGVNQAYFTRWYQHYDRLRDRSDFAAYWTDDMAALYLLTGETKFADVAIREAMKQVRTGGESQYALGRLSEVTLTYDWCHDRLSAAQQDSIVTYCLAMMQIPGPDEPYRARDGRWQYALAIWGEAGSQNAAVDAKLQSCIDLAEKSIFPCLDAISSGGTTGYYPGVFFSNHLNFVDCLRFATGYQGPILQSRYWNNSPTFWLQRLRPDLQWMRTTGRYNMSDAYAWGYFSYFASRMGNHFAQTAANIFARVSNTSDSDSGLLPIILWYLPGGVAEPLGNMSRTFADEDYGYYFHRSGWNLGASSTDIQVGFYNGPDVEPDHERTQNSFTVTRGRDDLLISAGKFLNSEDQHYTNYARRAVSRNTVLIYDPTEDFGQGVPNDGGQCASSLPRGHAIYPECGGGGDSGVGYRGDGQLLPAHEGLVFGVRGAATAAYSPSKVSGVCREFRMPRENWIFLQDRIALARPNLPVRLLFHSIERPTVDGTLTQVEGSAYGGIWRSTDSKVITIERGNSVARIYPVYVRGGAVEIRIVGGASPSNRIWAQNVKPTATLTWVSSPTAQGYECWVDGANRSPTQGGLTQAQIDSRNVEPHACGDWRVEILVSNPGSLVYAVTAIEIGPRGLPAHVPTWSETAGTVMVSVTGTGDDFSVHLPPTACSD
jgi:hypothetical protein